MIQLRDYQNDISARAVQLLKEHKICYLAMECRTGKTLTALAAAQAAGAKSVLMISKVKALPSIRNDYMVLNPPYQLTTINYESAHKVEGKFDLVILDEAHSLGSFPRPSQRAKAIKEICKNLPIIYLSGTPTPESYSQLYHQFWVSTFSPFRMYTNFYKWAKVYVNVSQRVINGNPMNDYRSAKKDAIDKVTKHLFIDYSQEEAGFEANIVEETLIVPMRRWTAEAINALKRDKILEWREPYPSEVVRVVLGDTPAKIMTKLHQLSSGSVITEDGSYVITDDNKARFIKEYFQGKKLAVFYVYQSELELLKRVFPKYTLTPEIFQASDELVFLGQVRSAREGVRLDTADALVFFNLEYSFLSYEQGRNRLSSKERTNPARVYFMCSDCGIEKDILDAVHGKEDFTYSYYKNKQAKQPPKAPNINNVNPNVFF